MEELGGDASAVFSVVVDNLEDGLDGPRNIAFSPHPGRHLGSFAEGRSFSQSGDELWIANGNAYDIVIVPDIGSVDQASLQRRDRGYYHYMHNITGLAFNSVGNSNRGGRDTYGYFATCQDSDNTYLGMKEPNFFMVRFIKTPGSLALASLLTPFLQFCSSIPPSLSFFLSPSLSLFLSLSLSPPHQGPVPIRLVPGVPQRGIKAGDRMHPCRRLLLSSRRHAARKPTVPWDCARPGVGERLWDCILGV